MCSELGGKCEPRFLIRTLGQYILHDSFSYFNSKNCHEREKREREREREREMVRECFECLF